MANSIVANVICQCGTELTIQHELGAEKRAKTGDTSSIRCPVCSRKYKFPGKILALKYKPVSGGWIEAPSKLIMGNPII